MYVTSTTNPTVYTLQGHNEQALASTVTKQMENENYTVKDLQLTGEWKYVAGDMLILNSPQRDISSDELKKITDFMSKGGKLVLLVDYVKEDMPNLQNLLNTYGVGLTKGIVLEGDANNMIQQATFLLPNMQSHAILTPLISGKTPVIIPQAQPLTSVKVKKSSLTIEPLLVTSDKAYARIDTQIQSMEKQPSDLKGPFNLAVAVTDKLDENNPDKTAKLIVFSSSYFLQDQFVQGSNGANLDMFMNSLNWMSDKKDSVTIRPKSLTSETLTMNQSEALIIAGLSVIIIPALVAIAGVTIWLRRRHL
jgi:ABC-type uncharacterized transport system involved in gliding motility auxiliary subunit